MGVDSLPPKAAPAVPRPIEQKPVEAAKPAAPAVKPAATGLAGKIGEGFDALKKKLMSVSGRYNAQPLPPSAQTADLKAMVAAQRSAVNAGGSAAAKPSSVPQNTPGHVADSKAAGRGDPNALPEVVAAKANAARMADVPFDVSARADSVDGILKATPQIDANDATKTDMGRCAAASTFNAMLIEQRPAENAMAMQKYGGKIGYPFTESENAAIRSFESGKLTPKEAGVLQECVFNMAKHNDDLREARSGNKGPDRVTGDGITAPGAAEVLAGLRAQGGMRTMKEVQIQMKESEASDGTKFNHATLCCEKSDGTWTTTNTWPNKDGESTVGHSPQPLDLVTYDSNGKKIHNPNATGLVTLTNFGGKPGVSFAYPSNGPAGQPQLTRGKAVDFDPNSSKSGTLKGFEMFLHDLESDKKIRVDSDTGTPLPDAPYPD